MMKTQYETLIRTNWESEESTMNEVPSMTGSTNVARTGRIRIGVVLALVAVLAFMAGVALGPTLHRDGEGATVGWQTVTGPLLVQTPPHPSPAPVQQATPVTTGALYDNGWAGGPGKGYHDPPVSDARLPTWTACTTCYDQGWAGGPGKGYHPPTTP